MRSMRLTKRTPTESAPKRHERLGAPEVGYPVRRVNLVAMAKYKIQCS